MIIDRERARTTLLVNRQGIAGDMSDSILFESGATQIGNRVLKALAHSREIIRQSNYRDAETRQGFRNFIRGCKRWRS
jgi:hypothetical protein